MFAIRKCASPSCSSVHNKNPATCFPRRSGIRFQDFLPHPPPPPPGETHRYNICRQYSPFFSSVRKSGTGRYPELFSTFGVRKIKVHSIGNPPPPPPPNLPRNCNVIPYSLIPFLLNFNSPLNIRRHVHVVFKPILTLFRGLMNCVRARNMEIIFPLPWRVTDDVESAIGVPCSLAGIFFGFFIMAALCCP